MNEKDIAEALTTPIPAATEAGADDDATQAFNQRVAQFYVGEGVAGLLERGSENDLAAGAATCRGGPSVWTAGRSSRGAAANTPDKLPRKLMAVRPGTARNSPLLPLELSF